MVVALAVLRRRIVDLVEPHEELLVRDHARIEHDAYGLRMTGAAARDLLVARLRRLAADVADVDIDDAIGHLHPVLDAPEAAGTEDRDLAWTIFGRGLLRRPGIGAIGRAGRERSECE